MREKIKEQLQTFFGQIMNTKILIVIFIVGVGLMLIPAAGQKDVSQEMTLKEDYRCRIEQDLSEIISQIKGAGKVEVMVTLSDKGDTVYASDEHTQRDETSKSIEKNHVFSKSSNEETPLIIRQTEPEISGVLICADGAANPQVKSNIISAVSALLGIKTHRIEVLERG